MKKITLLITLFLALNAIVFAQKDAEKAFFYTLDDQYNASMVSKDSVFFAVYFAENFINCTPFGEINNKKAEIKALFALPLTQVERTMSEYDIFTLSDKIATMSVVKKLTRKDGSVMHVRRTTVFNLINDKWQAVSGQGTLVPMQEEKTTTEEEVKNTIKKLDIEEAIAFTALDFTILDKLWASNFRVNNPRNSISLSAEEVRQGLKTGRIKHLSIDRHIEQIFFQETMVVTMGNEDVKEADGHIVKRRYTNVWLKQGNDWKLSFRHANLVCP